jgi:ribosome-associated translation inhibitor RaiA
MQIPLHISFHNLDHSDAVDAYARAEAGKLDKFYDRITACRVAVEAPHRGQHKGKLYRVRVDLVVPGAELTAARNPSAHGEHADIHVAVRDAFRAARRQLQDHVRRRREPIGAVP